MGVTDATRAAASNYELRGPAEARSRGEEEWRRSSGFYEFWGEILGGDDDRGGDRGRGGGRERRYQRA